MDQKTVLLVNVETPPSRLLHSVQLLVAVIGDGGNEAIREEN
jgi:hypothetical protein